MGCKQKIIIIQHDDFKSKAWATAALNNNYGLLLYQSGSPMFLPFIYLQKTLFNTRPSALVFRYIGDYKSLFLTILRLLSEILTIGAVKLFRSEIFWICHNVDNETRLYYPLINKVRRNLVKKNAKKIFVLDSLLIKHAQTILKVNNSKLDYLCFGRTDNTISEFYKDSRDLAYLAERYRKWIYLNHTKRRTKYIGLWIGAAAEKLFAGLKALSVFSNNQEDQEPLIGFIVIGKIGDWLKKRDHDLYDELQKSPNILFLDKHLNIETIRWKSYADFIWKPCDDISINMTAYNAALNKLPIIGLPGTFLSEFIEHYEIGFTIDPETISSKDFVKKLSQYNPNCANKFLKNKTWEVGAKKMFDSLYG